MSILFIAAAVVAGIAIGVVALFAFLVFCPFTAILPW